MRVAGRYRTVRRSDHAVPAEPTRSLTRDGRVDIRAWRKGTEAVPLLLVNASRKNGNAVLRNRFRRRVRMAFLEVVRSLDPASLHSSVIWVRPARGLRLTSDIPYDHLKGQLMLALTHWTRQ